MIYWSLPGKLEGGTCIKGSGIVADELESIVSIDIFASYKAGRRKIV